MKNQQQPTGDTERDIRVLFERLNAIDEEVTPSGASRLPSGIIVIWGGFEKDIPTGWVLCDGNNDTPDLRDYAVVGSGHDYDVGDTGNLNTFTASPQVHYHSLCFIMKT